MHIDIGSELRCAVRVCQEIFKTVVTVRVCHLPLSPSPTKLHLQLCE